MISGIARGIAAGVARLGGQPGGSGFTYYVDSVSGLDANSGASPALAKQTFAGLPTLTAGQTLGLARGSYWREQYDVPADNIEIGVYGTGAMPVIDGADIATTWTQPDAGTYPNVWARSWTRQSATTTGQEYLGLWVDGVRPRYALNATTDLNTNGGWFTTSLTTQTSTVSIYSTDDPNTNGKLYEITRRHYGVNAHSTTLGVPRTGFRIAGPIEIKRCVGHYNALAGSGTGKKLLLRDGNIHNTVTEGDLTDVACFETSPQILNTAQTHYRVSGVGFNPVNTRGMVLFPGGTSRLAHSGFTAHASGGTPFAESMTLVQPMCRGANLGSAAGAPVTITNGYCEDAETVSLDVSAGGLTATRCIVRDTTAATLANVTLRLTAGSGLATVTDLASYTLKGGCVVGVAGRPVPVFTNCALICPGAGQIALNSGEQNVHYSIYWSSGRQLNGVTSSYVGDFNVFYTVGGSGAQINWNGQNFLTFATALSLFQAASGQDLNSVFLKAADQVSGNGIAFWLGVSSGANAGPPDGDWRINPSAKVYNGAGGALTGLFADGVTPITAAGPQEHWDFNTRAVVSGPPSRFPVLPATIAEMRTYIEDPAAWDFYP